MNAVSNTTGDRLDAAFAAWRGGELERARSLCFDHLGEDGARAAKAHALLAQIADREGDAEAAIAAYDEALRHDPAMLPAHNNRAHLLEHEGRLEAALAGYEAALALAPQHPQIRANKARTLGRLGRFEESLAIYKAIEAEGATTADMWHDRARILHEAGRPEQALEAYAAALALNPFHETIAYERSLLLFRLDRHAEAATAASEARRLMPRSARLAYILGCALRSLEQRRDALAAQNQAVALDPQHAAAHCERGWLLRELGHAEEALDAFDQALELEPAFRLALSGLGLACHTLGMDDAALASFDKALDLAPDYVEAWINRGSVLRRVGRITEAVASLDRALALRPDSVTARVNRIVLLTESGRPVEAEAAFREMLAADPHQAGAHGNLLHCLLYVIEDRDRLAAEHRAWGERFGPAAIRHGTWPNDRDADRPMRVGFVSSDFTHHPVGRAFLSTLEAFDSERVHTVCYNTRHVSGEVTEAIRAACHLWRESADLSDRALADLVLEDRIDILVDLAGHTSGNRLRMFALKPAPVQATWLGYPFTTGLSAIDYIIMDPVAVPEGYDPGFVERIARLPGGRFCYNPPADSPDVAQPPMLERGHVTFGSFNNPTKLTPEVLATWAAILHRVPGARLLLKARTLGDAEVAAHFRAMLGEHGIGPERIELRGKSPYHEMLAEYGDIDIALDPFPFSGGATSGDVLWMGVPVVTLAGPLPPSRQTLGFLETMGREEWAAETVAGYIEKAVTLAGDPEALAAARAEQRERMRGSPLCDGRRMARELEAAFRTMWRRYVDGDL